MGRQHALRWPRWTADLATHPQIWQSPGMQWWLGCALMQPGSGEMRFQSNRCVRKSVNALSDTHTGILNHQNCSTHWFWLRRSIIGYLGGDDRLWLHGFGSEWGSEAREWDKQQHRAYLPLESCNASLELSGSDDVLKKWNLGELMGLHTAVLGATRCKCSPFTSWDYKVSSWLVYF